MDGNNETNQNTLEQQIASQMNSSQVEGITERDKDITHPAQKNEPEDTYPTQSSESVVINPAREEKPSIQKKEKPEINGTKEQDRTNHSEREKDRRIPGVGEWMITILVYLLPGINIIVMAIWAFSSKGNLSRRNLSRACLLWIIILLLGYVVAMTVAGFTILDIFPRQP